MKLNTIVLLLCAITCMVSCSKNRSENSELSDEEEGHMPVPTSHTSSAIWQIQST